MSNALAASSLTRLLSKIYGPDLDDRANRAALEMLTANLQATPYAAVDSPDLLTPLRIYEREAVVHGRWVEVVRRGMRADIVTNIGCARPTVWNRQYRVLPRQVVLVFLPHAPVQHILFPTIVNDRLGIEAPHVALSQVMDWPTPQSSQFFGVRHWRANGYPLMKLQGGHSYRFAGCIDGVLYAESRAERLDPSRAIAALDELRAMADLPWHPPTDAELGPSHAAALAEQASTRRYKTALIVILGAVIIGPILAMGVAMIVRALS